MVRDTKKIEILNVCNIESLKPHSKELLKVSKLFFFSPTNWLILKH